MGRDIDILIKGGRVYDGTGRDAVDADIAIAGDKIVSISAPRGGSEAAAGNVIEARGLSVAPGFIDTHAHSEFMLLADCRAEGKVLQGITTEINGNCGLSAAPLLGEAMEHRETDLRELDIPERWSSLGEYFRILEDRGLAINFLTLIGHGNLRASVVGYENRGPDVEELGRMCSLLNKTIGEGAIGLSTGLIYPPGVYSETDELISLSASVRDRIYTSHMRSEGNALTESVRETVRIGREAGIAVHISHIKTGGKENWGKIDEVISLIENGRDDGIRITADRYPYTAASTDLDAVLPAWTYEGGAEEELRRLRNPDVRERIRKELLQNHPSADYWEGIIISSLNREENRWMEGLTLSDIAGREGKRPVDLLLDVLIRENLRVGAIFRSMNEDNLMRFLSLPYVMVGSDSSARSSDGPTRKGKPHPRGFGTFPRFVGRYARDRKLMTISEAIRRVTMLPAETFGLWGRGLLKEGCFADIVIFDEDKIADKATFEEPFLPPVGVNYVFVNGRTAVCEGSQTGLRGGRVLRHAR